MTTMKSALKFALPQERVMQFKKKNLWFILTNKAKNNSHGVRKAKGGGVERLPGTSTHTKNSYLP